MSKLKIVSAVVSTFATTPIWFYLVYFMLKAAGAGGVEWLLFGIYIPFTMVVVFCTTLAAQE